jgi:hypothetical protein
MKSKLRCMPNPLSSLAAVAMLALFGCQGAPVEANGKSTSAIELELCEYEACSDKASKESGNCNEARQCNADIWKQYGPELERLAGVKNAAEEQVKKAKDAYFQRNYNGGTFAEHECWKVAQKRGLEGGAAIGWCDEQAETDEQVKAARRALADANDAYYARQKDYFAASEPCNAPGDRCNADVENACGAAPERTGWGECK